MPERLELIDPARVPDGTDATRTPETDAGVCWAETLTALANRSLDPLFWRASRLGEESAWWQHVPFAHWIVCATSPRVLVELGTHNGVSYSAFCNAVVRAGLGTRCHAVDTWQGDRQAGLYGPEVLADLHAFHEEHFGAFSTLLHCTFDEALAHIEDESIDLLHVDGLHTYEATRHDFESWLPKLSDRAVILFHDINVRREDFGVWRIWAELYQQYPAFDFLHGYGLGVLAIGKRVPAPVAVLCNLTDPAAIATIRSRFASLGERWSIDTRERMLSRDIGKTSAAAEQLRAELAQRDADLEAARQAADWRGELLNGSLARATDAEKEHSDLRNRAEQAEALVADLEAERARLGNELDAALNSTFWRITSPARKVAAVIPRGLRRRARRIVRAV